MTDEQPTHGGSYVRQPDGTLRRAETPAPPQDDTPKPKSRRTTKE